MRKQTLLVVLAVTLQAADSFPPSAEQKREMQDKLSALSAHVKGLAAKQVDAALLADVDVYWKAAEWILRYPEEFTLRPMRPTPLPRWTRASGGRRSWNPALRPGRNRRGGWFAPTFPGWMEAFSPTAW